MSGYVPVPQDALQAVQVHEWHAVLDLFQRGHALRWRRFSVTERALASRWKVSGRRVWELLDELADLGLLLVERGSQRVASRVTVFDPSKAVKQSGQQARQHNDTVGKQPIEEREAQDEAQTGETLSKAENDPDRSIAERGRAREANPLEVAELLALQEQDEPQHGMRPQRDLAALSRALLRGSTVEALRWLWDWSGAAPDAEACRKGDWRRWAALLKHPLGDERLQAAERWHRAGRPTSTGPPNRASPGKPYRVADDPTFATREPP